MHQIPEHGSCFVCGTVNPHSIGLTWFVDEQEAIYARHTFTLSHQGPPNCAHGGASAAVLDEAMGAAVWHAGYSVAAVNLQVDYRKPVPLGAEVTVHARIAEREEHKLIAESQILLPDGTVAVEGRGIYVEAPHLFKDANFRA